MKGFFLNDTSDYHRKGLETLGWELTVCNCLEPYDSPCRKILKRSETFGTLLSSMLLKHVHGASIKRFLEVGGGYGYVSRDLMLALPGARATLLDISPFLLSRQKENLGNSNADYVLMDFFETDSEFLSGFDLAVFNENVGDFPCACGLTQDLQAHGFDRAIKESAELISRYSLIVPEGPFNFNLGAIKAVSRVCSAGVPAAFFSEHSCEASAPPRFAGFIDTASTGFPERISLKGHDEYTVKFSHLEAVARFHGYSVTRGSYLDFIEPKDNGLINYVLRSGSIEDEHEVIRHFLEDLCKYEYLLITA